MMIAYAMHVRIAMHTTAENVAHDHLIGNRMWTGTVDEMSVSDFARCSDLVMMLCRHTRQLQLRMLL